MMTFLSFYLWVGLSFYLWVGIAVSFARLILIFPLWDRQPVANIGKPKLILVSIIGALIVCIAWPITIFGTFLEERRRGK